MGVIIGGGIGGLTAALCLHAAGIEATVLEAAPEMRPLGVGINLLPHSVRVMQRLGLADALLRQGVATRELVYFNKFGQRIWGEPRGVHADYEAPQISLSRGALQNVLLDAALERLGADRVRVGHRLHAFEQSGAGIVAHLHTPSGPRSIDAKFMIAADGIHSAARSALYPHEGAPLYAGRVLWRATTRAKPFMTGASMVMIGHRAQKFVAYPIAPPDAQGLQTINWIAELEREALRAPQDWNRRADLNDVLPAFESWRFDWLDTPALIGGAEAVFEYPLVDRDPLPRWSFGAMTLLGDAAHPMFPIGSNGASQAILDADAIAETMRRDPSPADAFAAYEDMRRGKTGAIVLANRNDGPELCMQLAEDRAPKGFADVHDVISQAELEEIAARYKSVAGFDRASLAAKR